LPIIVSTYIAWLFGASFVTEAVDFAKHSRGLSMNFNLDVQLISIVTAIKPM